MTSSSVESTNVLTVGKARKLGRELPQLWTNWDWFVSSFVKKPLSVVPTTFINDKKEFFKFLQSIRPFCPRNCRFHNLALPELAFFASEKISGPHTSTALFELRQTLPFGLSMKTSKTPQTIPLLPLCCRQSPQSEPRLSLRRLRGL